MLFTDFPFMVLAWLSMRQKVNGIARISPVLKLKQHGAHGTFSHSDKCMLIAFCLLANYSYSSGLKKKTKTGYFILVTAASCFLKHWEREAGRRLRADTDLTAGGTDAALGFKVFKPSYIFVLTTSLNPDDTWGVSASGRFTQIGSKPSNFIALVDSGPSP